MSTHKSLEKICCVVLALSILITLMFMKADKLGIKASEQVLKYETTLFDTSRVHTIDILIEDWDGFLETATDEEYADCTVVIDDETLSNVGIRAKGNSSLSMVSSSNSDRYSFKLEFDHYDDTKLYNGLDKLCLNNIIQDNTYMKDYISYQLMSEMGVASPLCSYISVHINGEDFGLYLAVEAMEESFLQRNYGNDYGELYKPESIRKMAGGGKGVNKEGPVSQNKKTQNTEVARQQEYQNMLTPQNGESINGSNMEKTQMPNMGMQGGAGPNMGGDIQGEALAYIDDEFDNYSYIFDNAVTKVSTKDKNAIIDALKNINQNTNLEEYVAIEEVIQYFVVHNFVLNFDSYTGSIMHNYYLYEEGGRLSLLPWDYNLAFNSFMTNISTENLVNFPIDTPVSTGTVESRPMLSWIFENEVYTQMYYEIFAEFVVQVFDSGYFSNMVDNIDEMISPYVELDATKFCTYEEYKLGVATLKEFCLLRAKSVSEQLNGSIGLTTKEQETSENFVDASTIEITNMGSENMNKGEHNMHAPLNLEEDEVSVQSQKEGLKDEYIQIENNTNNPSPANVPQRQQSAIHNGMEEVLSNTETFQNIDWKILIASTMILSVALLFVFHYKKRRY